MEPWPTMTCRYPGPPTGCWTRIAPSTATRANGSVPYFWMEHVAAYPEDSWRSLASSVYAAEYMIEYRQGDDIDSLLRSMIPGVSEYVRMSMGGPNELEPPPVKESSGGDTSHTVWS